MFTKTSEKIAQKLKQNDTIDDEHYEICRDGLQQGLSVLLNIVTTILIGIMLNMLWQAILFTVLYIPLRSNAGGYHASTALLYLFSFYDDCSSSGNEVPGYTKIHLHHRTHDLMCSYLYTCSCGRC